MWGTGLIWWIPLQKHNKDWLTTKIYIITKSHLTPCQTVWWLWNEILVKPSSLSPLSCDFGIPPVHHIKPYVKILKKLLSNITLLEQEETQCIPAFSIIGCTPYFSAFPSIFVWEYNVVDLWVDRKPRGEWQAAIYRNELTSTQQLMALPSNHT